MHLKEANIIAICQFLIDGLRQGKGKSYNPSLINKCSLGNLRGAATGIKLVIHLLRHYSSVTQTITSENRSLTRNQLQQAIDYIHAHLDCDLSLSQIAKIINISPTYFASLFKRATGTSPHQYVIQQRVERAKWMLLKTDSAIADIALQVGFSSQSHLTQQFKRLTGMTPKQVRSSP